MERPANPDPAVDDILHGTLDFPIKLFQRVLAGPGLQPLEPAAAFTAGRERSRALIADRVPFSRREVLDLGAVCT